MIINWGDVPYKAFITVTYPSGTCTVTNGDKSFSHSGGGTYTFTVTNRGAWTVHASHGDASASSTANLTSFGQTLSLTLSYTCTINANLSISASNSDGYTTTKTQVLPTKYDLSAYKTLKFTVTSLTCTSRDLWLNGASYFRFGVNPSSASAPSVYTTVSWTTGAMTVSVDVSNVSSGYIGVLAACSGRWAGSGTISAKVSTVILSS